MVYFRAKNDKLAYRFYEPLVLLEALGRAQGERVPLERFGPDLVGTQDAIQARRTLLDQLCIVCDFKKGGMTTTAMCLEFKPSGPTYWVSSPEGVESKTSPFLRTTLDLLAQVASQPRNMVLRRDIQAQLFRYFANSCRPRLISTWSLLQGAVQREEPEATSHEGREFWAQCRQPIRADETELLSFCDWAYSARRSHHLRRPSTEFGHDQQSQFTVRHYIGRIASVYRAAKILTRLAPDHLDLLENFEIAAVPSGRAQPAPPFDELITLDGIARRMISSTDQQELGQIQQGLNSLDRTISLMSKIQDQWTDPKFRPRVHAEIELLEAAYRAGIAFYGGDRYIACSKAACFCCYHYISHHPGTFVRPATHNNLYPNWRAPDLPQPENAADTAVRRKLLNAMVAEFRAVAKSRILGQSGLAVNSHPDSTTGITRTATILATAAPDVGPVEFANLQRSFEQLGLHLREDDDEEEGGVSLGNALALTVA